MVDIIAAYEKWQVSILKKLLFVMNPCAGMRKANKALVDILAQFNRGGFDVTVHITAQRDDARQVVQSRAAEFDIVVCCGGDGTFNECIAGLMHSGADVPVGYIPAGSTNDFAGSLKLATDPVEAAKAIVNGSAEAYDVCSFGGRYFTYVASFGAFTKASYATPQNIKNALGHTAYILEGIQELSQLRKMHVKLELDGEIVEDDYIFGAICNSTSVGGILTLDPKQVDMGDGMFELLLVRAPRDLVEIGECIQAVQRQTYNCRMMTFRSAKEITIYADPNMPWTLDGEKEPGHEKVLVENLHHAFRLVR